MWGACCHTAAVPWSRWCSCSHCRWVDIGCLRSRRSRRGRSFLCDSVRKGSKECVRSWVTTGHDRSRICIFRGLPIPTRATCLQGTCACTHTHAVRNRWLVQTHCGLCTQQGKEKRERIFLLWFSLCSLIPQHGVTGTRMQHLGPARAPPLLPTALSPSLPQILDRELSISPRPAGAVQSQAGYANTDLAIAVPSLSSTQVHAWALPPSVPCAASCPAPAASPPRWVPRAAWPLSLCTHLCCTIHHPSAIFLWMHFSPTHQKNQIYLLLFLLFAFNIFMCFARSRPYLLVCFSPSSSAIPSCCHWKIK